LNKSTTRRPIYRGGGSIGIAACARSTLLAGKHPDDPDRAVLTQVKNNLGPRGPALGYRVTSKGPFATIAWDGATNVTPEDLCRDVRNDPASQLAEAWLKDLLSNGPVPAAEIEAKALAQDLGYRTIQAVKKKLNIDSRRVIIDGKPVWEWLPPGGAAELPNLEPLPAVA
jgi:putative DNA primase/helicase